jgi:hypothetical protein
VTQVLQSRPDSAATADISAQPWVKQAVALTAAGAVLGPLCDGLHSSHDVLHYASPSHIDFPLVGLHLETCWWVPALFGLAGLLIGLGYPLLDTFLDGRPTGTILTTKPPRLSLQDPHSAPSCSHTNSRHVAVRLQHLPARWNPCSPSAHPSNSTSACISTAQSYP